MAVEDDVVNVLRENPDGLTAEQLANELGRNSKDMAKSGHSAVYEAKKNNNKLEEKIDKKWISDEECYKYFVKGIDREALYDSIAKTSEILRRDVPKRDGVDVVLETDEPVMLVVLTDLHLGHKYSAYDRIKRACKELSDYDNVYFIGLGDLIDNSLNTHAPQGAQNLSDKNQQLEMVKHLFLDVMGSEKILRLYEGNHEIRSWISDHFLPSKWMALQYSSSYGYFAEPFIIEIGDKKWQFFMRHKATGNSQYDPVHNCVRTCLFDGAKLARDADIVVTAHEHIPGIGQWVVGGKMRWMMSTPCMVDFDDYAERVGYVSGADTNIPAIYLRENEDPVIKLDYKDIINDYK